MTSVPTFSLKLGDDVYDFGKVFQALGFAHDAAAAVDVGNAAKNLSEPKLSPLTLLIEEAVDMLVEIRDRHAKPDQGEGNPDDPASADA